MKLTVLRPFWWAGQVLAVGDIVDVPARVDVADLCNAGKAAPYVAPTAPPPEPPPAPSPPTKASRSAK